MYVRPMFFPKFYTIVATSKNITLISMVLYYTYTCTCAPYTFKHWLCWRLCIKLRYYQNKNYSVAHDRRR